MRAPSDPPAVPASIEITSMKRKHVREVLMIERQVYPRPWSAALFFSEIGQRKTRHYVVAIHDKAVVGYGGLMVHGDEGHITTIAVDPAFQGRRIGARLMLNLMNEAVAREAATVALEVRVANWGAQRLYAWFGFRPVGIRRNYYAETGEDALVMWVEGVQGPDVAARIRTITAKVGT